MSNITERQRVEQLLFIDQIAHVVREGAKDVREPVTAATLQLLGRAREDSEAGLTASERDKLFRRLRRLDADVFDPHRRLGQPLAAFGLVVFCILRELADAGYLAPVRGSALDQALAKLLPALETQANRPAALERVEKAASQAIRTLESAGYLVGFRKSHQ